MYVTKYINQLKVMHEKIVCYRENAEQQLFHYNTKSMYLKVYHVIHGGRGA